MSTDESADMLTPAQIRVTRQLLGLSQAEMGRMLGVRREAVDTWERGIRTPRPGAVADIERLRDEHDADTTTYSVLDPVMLPSGPHPRGWYVAIGARILDESPGRRIEWASA